MQLADMSVIQAEVASIQSAIDGFSIDESSSAASAEQVAKVCEAHVGAYSDVGSIPWLVILSLATQILPIIFPDGNPTIDKLKSIIDLISKIFVQA